MQKILWWEFSILLFLLPLLFYPLVNYFPLPVAFLGIDLRTAELFELPKMFFVYLMALVLGGSWCIGVLSGQLHVRIKWTWVLISYLCFVIFYGVSTLFSIDKFSSIFGHPTRIHGGLLSYICYALITFIYVASDFSLELRKKHLQLLLWSGLATSVYAILQRFGVDASMWNQDVQSRVFGTFGQPNWMAAYLSVMLPIASYFVIQERLWSKKIMYLGFLMSCLVAIFLSGSRSGLSGGLIAMTGVGLCLGWSKNVLQKVDRRNLVIGMVGVCVVIGYGLWVNLWGRVETMTIRLAVWEGAWQIFGKYPWLGSGPETFAFAFYENRPLALLRTEEWDLLYNKAHNEILHYLATIGVLGTGAFGAYCVAMVYETKRGFLLGAKFLNIYLCCGWWGLWVAHLFGFSVSATGLLLFLLPAMVNSEFAEIKSAQWTTRLNEALQKGRSAIALFFLAVCVYMMIELSGLVAAELANAKYKEKFRQGNVSAAITEIEKAVRLTPYNPWLRSELGWAYASAVRILHAQGGDPQQLADYEQGAQENLILAGEMSPRNTLLAQREILAYAYLFKKDGPKYEEVLYQKMKVIESELPNEIALLAQLPKIYREMGREQEAKLLLQKFVKLKPDYQKGHEQLLEIKSAEES